MNLDNQPVLYFNENMEVPLVKELLASGISVVHTYDVGNGGISDDDQLEYAANNNYVLVTHNRKDFLQLHSTWIESGKTHSGIVLIKFFEDIKDMHDKLTKFLQNIYPEISTPFCVSVSKL